MATAPPATLTPEEQVIWQCHGLGLPASPDLSVLVSRSTLRLLLARIGELRGDAQVPLFGRRAT